MSGQAPTSPFSLLLLRQRSQQQRERLHKMREQCKLTEDDALWALVAVVEAYCDDLQTRANNLPPAPPPTASTERWLSISIGAAAQAALLALAYAVGEHAAGASAPRAAWWAVPAGWITFVLALPALILVASSGWRTRRTDPSLGWGLVTLSVVASLASLGALFTFVH